MENSDSIYYRRSRGRGYKEFISLFPITTLLKLDLTRLLDEAARVAAAGSEEVVNPITGDVVPDTSFPSLHGLWDG